eukprot:COSAG06_NODE_330_length_17413_cov_12.112510_6_plen_59_part_00
MPRGRRGRRQKAMSTLNDLETQADRRRRSSEWTTLATTHGSPALTLVNLAAWQRSCCS